MRTVFTTGFQDPRVSPSPRGWSKWGEERLVSLEGQGKTNSQGTVEVRVINECSEDLIENILGPLFLK